MELMQFDAKNRFIDWIVTGLNLADLYYKEFKYNKESRLSMSKKYLVKLFPNPVSELFKNTNKNVMEVRLQTIKNRLISNKEYEVELEVTIEDMLGFGAELIRQAMETKQNKTNKYLDDDSSIQ